MGKLLEELARAQLEFKPISKSGKNPFLHNDYATLDDIVNATKDALANHGISIIHRTEAKTDKTFFITEIKHFEDDDAELSTATAIDTFMKVSDKQTAIQIYGSIITYLRRYHIGMLLNLCTDEDMDGNDGGKADKKEKPKESPKPEQKPQENPADDKLSQQAEEFVNRLMEFDTKFALPEWKKKHQEEINKLPSADRAAVMKVYSEQLKKLSMAAHAEPELDGLGNGESEHNPPA